MLLISFQSCPYKNVLWEVEPLIQDLPDLWVVKMINSCFASRASLTEASIFSGVLHPATLDAGVPLWNLMKGMTCLSFESPFQHLQLFLRPWGGGIQWNIWACIARGIVVLGKSSHSPRRPKTVLSIRKRNINLDNLQLMDVMPYPRSYQPKKWMS